MSAGARYGVLEFQEALVVSGNSGWKNIVPGDVAPVVFDAATFRLVPAAVSGAQTLDVKIQFAWTMIGLGLEDVVTFAQVVNTNLTETKHLNLLTKVPYVGFYRVVWTIAGASPLMEFSIYHVLTLR